MECMLDILVTRFLWWCCTFSWSHGAATLWKCKTVLRQQVHQQPAQKVAQLQRQPSLGITLVDCVTEVPVWCFTSSEAAQELRVNRVEAPLAEQHGGG